MIVFAAVVVGATATENPPCAAPEVPLTHELIGAADGTVLDTVTCIPTAFRKDTLEQVTIPALPNLKFVEDGAFENIQITWGTDYPVLQQNAELCNSGCPKFVDAETALTKELYAATQDFKDVTCIPPREFRDHETEIQFENDFDKLVTIGSEAFYEKESTFDMTFATNTLPRLTEIGDYAFATNADLHDDTREQISRRVVFDGDFLKLQRVGKYGFASVLSLTFKSDKLENLHTIDRGAFSNVVSKCVIDISGNFNNLRRIGDGAFVAGPTSEDSSFSFSGTFPVLEHIGKAAFAAMEYSQLPTVTFDGLPAMVTLGNKAFAGFVGKLTFTGDFPKLETIGSAAFAEVNTIVGNPIDGTRAVVDLTNAQNLKHIGDRAFRQCYGTITIPKDVGEKLITIKIAAFAGGGTQESSVVLGETGGTSSLEKIGEAAFDDFMGSVMAQGTFDKLNVLGIRAFKNARSVVVDAAFPLLPTVAAETFSHTCAPDTPDPCRWGGRVDAVSKVTFAGNAGFQQLETIDDKAFLGFAGTLTISGLYDNLVSIGPQAFANLKHEASSVTFSGLPDFTTLGEGAFLNSDEVLTVTGCYPKFASELTDAATQKFKTAQLKCVEPPKTAPPPPSRTSRQKMKAGDWVAVACAIVIVLTCIVCIAWPCRRKDQDETYI